jgi:hypothetical protein
MVTSTSVAGCAPLTSGIILPIPEAEEIVGDLRRLHDPQARYGVPAHITLLYPFARPLSVDGTLGALRRFFGRMSSFDFSLTEIRRFPATAYLHPEPSATFIELTQMLARQWPEYPPYGGAFSTIIPHLTVADHASSGVLESTGMTVAGYLPIRCRATEAWLMCSDENGFWSRRDIFRFREGD